MRGKAKAFRGKLCKQVLTYEGFLSVLGRNPLILKRVFFAEVSMLNDV